MPSQMRWRVTEEGGVCCFGSEWKAFNLAEGIQPSHSSSESLRPMRVVWRGRGFYLYLESAGCPVEESIENAPELEELLPPKGGPCFKFSAEDDRENTQGHALLIELNTMVRGRKTVREIISWIEKNLIIPVNGHKVAVVEVVIQTLLDIGSKSFTHIMTILERYGHIISKLWPDQDTQVMLIDEISSYWKNNTQNAAITIDRMMGYRLISNLVIVIWVFLPFNISRFHLSDHPREILRNAINKTYNRNCNLRKEIQSLEKNAALAEEGVRRTNSEYEAAEAKLGAMDSEPVQAERPGRMKRLKAYADRAKGDAISILESLEAKEALLARALEENKALFISLYKNFGNAGLVHIIVQELWQCPYGTPTTCVC